MEILERIRNFNVQEEVSQAIYQQGVEQYKQRRVKLKSTSDTQISLTVMGSELHTVNFVLKRNRFSYDCDCSTYHNWGTCQHIVAADLFVKNSSPSLFKPVPDTAAEPDFDAILADGRIQQGFSGYGADADPDQSDGWLLVLSLREHAWSEFYEPVYLALDLAFAPQGLSRSKKSRLSGRIFDYVAEDPQRIALLRPLSKQLDPAACTNAPWPLVHSLLRDKKGQKGFLSGREMENLFTHSIPIFIGDEAEPVARPLYWDQNEYEIDLLIEKCWDNGTSGVTFTPSIKGQKLGQGDGWGSGKQFDPNRHWILIDDQIVRFHRRMSAEQVAALDEVARLHYRPLEETVFLDGYFEGLLAHVNLEGDRLNEVDVEPTDPILQFTLHEMQDETTGEVTIFLQAGFGYGAFAIDWSDELQFHFWRMADYDPTTSVELLHIQRNIPAETDYLKGFDQRRYGLSRFKQRGAGYFKLKRGMTAAQFLIEMVPKLTADGYPLFGEATLQHNRVSRDRPQIEIDVVSHTDWFDLKPLIRFGNVPVGLEQVKLAVKNRQPFVVLDDGAVGRLPEVWFDQLRPMFGLGEQQGEHFRFGEQQVLLIDKLLELADVATPDDHFSERLAELQNFDGIAENELSWAFTGELRPYQRAGFNWLHFLRDYGYGGILADDMGLGKTVQVLAFLQACRDLEDDQKPADLIIMPRSLLFNWQREAERFTPNLRTLIYYGNKREQARERFGEYDLILTTYGTVLRDVEPLQLFDFNTIVLDESQAIKNPSAKTGRAVRTLNGRHRLAMTGTPVENTTLELWSQFAFLMPGYLGNQSYFRTEFRNPIENQNDKKVGKYLHDVIRPFVMRRTKEQVALDLPKRTEEVIYLEMEPNQRRLYNKVRDQYRAELLGLIEAGQVEQSRMVMLTGLLRLRQICLHPKLMRPEFKGEAAKFVYLNDTLAELEANGHRALIFSQFTSALDLIGDVLDGAGFPAVRIDGGTRQRQAVVDRFQQGEAAFFLLSLKAAGVGLNLTAADYVILMDPWWNPAVERQAIDRAYRIGQTKPVFVFRLIMRDSVEEKVLEMQARKRDIADQLIQVEDSFVKRLSVEDIRGLFS